MPDTTMTKLKPCPFCGHGMQIEHHHGLCGPAGDHALGCILRNFDFCDYCKEVEAIAAWNTRADDHRVASQAELVEALEWYGEQSRLCRLIHGQGDAGRTALQNDGGQRAKAALNRAQNGAP